MLNDLTQQSHLGKAQGSLTLSEFASYTLGMARERAGVAWAGARSVALKLNDKSPLWAIALMEKRAQTRDALARALEKSGIQAAGVLWGAYKTQTTAVFLGATDALEDALLLGGAEGAQSVRDAMRAARRAQELTAVGAALIGAVSRAGRSGRQNRDADHAQDKEREDKLARLDSSERERVARECVSMIADWALATERLRPIKASNRMWRVPSGPIDDRMWRSPINGLADNLHRLSACAESKWILPAFKEAFARCPSNVLWQIADRAGPVGGSNLSLPAAIFALAAELAPIVEEQKALSDALPENGLKARASSPRRAL